MKSIGLIGGMSWESTALYYQIINREVGRRCGKLHSAKLLMNSLDFEEVVACQKASAWNELATKLSGAARGPRIFRRRLRLDRHEHDAPGR